MDFIGKTILNILGIKKAYMESKTAVTEGHVEEPAKRKKYTGIPAIPADIGYNSSKATGGSKSTGVISHVSSNPAALLGMIRRSVMGDKIGTQKYMRYRIIAQFFTVFALVAGVTVFAATAPTTPPPPSNEDKSTNYTSKMSN
uniref:HIG1 domain-containing protein n=1 Tax=Panagrolaimus sp. PS1159 TaxID=55785 RepID=A0AC35FY59_9BILA